MRLLAGLFLVLFGGPVLVFFTGTGIDARFLSAVWFFGAAALGLLSGFTTGASEKAGTASEFFKFLTGGVLVPLLGGIGTMLGRTPEVTETFTYSGTQVVSHVTRSTFEPAHAVLYPVGIFASFLLAFGVMAILGILIGVRFRMEGVSIKSV